MAVQSSTLAGKIPRTEEPGATMGHWGLPWVTGGYSGVTESDTAEREHRHACDTEHLVVGNEHRQITSQ